MSQVISLLQELRQARQLSQEQLADVLQVKQAFISKLQRRSDMYQLVAGLYKFSI